MAQIAQLGLQTALQRIPQRTDMGPIADRVIPCAKNRPEEVGFTSHAHMDVAPSGSALRHQPGTTDLSD